MIFEDDHRTENERNLTMLVKQLVKKVRKTSPDDKLCTMAVDYLVRKNLIRTTDILRKV